MSILSTSANKSAVPASAALEFLAFTLGDEEYGIDIQNVQELRSYDTVTRLANAPAFISAPPAAAEMAKPQRCGSTL